MEKIKINNDMINGFCVYFLYKNEEVVYVGKSKCVLKRLFQHSGKEFDSFSYKTFENEEECSLQEEFYINKLKPKYNFKSTGYVPSKIYFRELRTQEEVEEILKNKGIDYVKNYQNGNIHVKKSEIEIIKILIEKIKKYGSC